MIDGAAPDRAARAWQAAVAADLHLVPTDARGIARAVRLFELAAENARRLLLLGDLFDLWITGAELREPGYAPLFDALRRARAGGLAIDFLAGNRDFNFSRADGAALGIDVLPSERLDLELAGVPTRLLHGDQLLTDDHAYQSLKRVVRSRVIRFLTRRVAAPLVQAIALGVRRRSAAAVVRKQAYVLRIVGDAVRAEMRSGARRLVCGHVHRLDRLDYGEGRELLVLPPFQDDGRFAVATEAGWRLCDQDGALSDLPPLRPPEGGAA